MGNDYKIDPPSKTDLSGAGLPKPWNHRIEYAAGKTQDIWVKQGVRDDLIEKGKLGFYFWDKSQDKNVELSSATLFHVATFIRVEGDVMDSQKNRTTYWSNYVQNSQKEQLTVWASNSNEPIAKGLYANIKKSLPKGANFTIILIVYEPVHDKLFALPATFMVSMGLKRSIGMAIGIEPEKVWLFDLSVKSYWAFRHVDYFAVDAKGDTYRKPPKGDLFFMPTFISGVISIPDVIAKVDHYREEVDTWYKSTKRAGSSAPQREDVPLPTQEPPSQNTTDDLPF